MRCGRVKKKKIGQILLERNFITEDILKEALEYQARFGTGITQYLLEANYIKEEDLAQCISDQFDVPYLPLRFYDIPEEIIKLVPKDYAKKYWLIPIDRAENVLTVVMANPLDSQAIQEVEKITDCKVQPFVGIISDIIKAIERYYHVSIEEPKLKIRKPAPLFIRTKDYVGPERRKFVRFKAKIDIHFPVQEYYKKSKTKNISFGGLLFESENILPVGSYVILQIDLPKKFSLCPIAAVVQVVRVAPLEKNRFDIGAKIVKIPREDAQLIIEYAKTCKDD
jgi:hypothetical protein